MRAELLSTPGLTEKEVQQIEELMEAATGIIQVDSDIARLAGELRRSNNDGRRAEQCPTCRKRLGGRLRLPDALIAATAITEDAVLVTGNIRDYKRIPNLKLDNPNSPTIRLQITPPI